MKSSLAFIAIVVGIVTLSSRQLSQSMPAISGTVVDTQTGRPLDGVRLFFSDSPTPPGKPGPNMTNDPPAGTSDASGSFRFEVPTAGRYFVLPLKDGFVYPRRQSAPDQPGVWVDVRTDQATENIQIAMVRESSIVGRVIEPDGRPAIGAPVSLLQYSYDDDGQRGLVSAGRETNGKRTDDRGEYRFFGLPPGEYYVRIYLEGLVGRWAAVYHSGSVDEQNAAPLHVRAGDELRLSPITLVERETVAVRLRFPDTTAQIGWLKSVHFESGQVLTASGGFAGFPCAACSNEMVVELARGAYDVMMNWGPLGGPQSYSSRVRLDATAGATSQELAPTSLVRIGVNLSFLQGNDQDIVPAGLRCILRATYQYVPIAGCRGEANIPPGSYDLRLEGLPRDAYVVSAEVGGQDIFSARIPIRTDTELAVVLRTPGAIIVGDVRGFAGERMAHATVALVPDPPLRAVSALYRSVTSDINGRFELRGVAPGTYQLFAWQDIEGAAYRNADFMQQFEGKGQEVRIQGNEPRTIDIRSF